MEKTIELVFINEDLFFEEFGMSADDTYLFVGKTYIIEYFDDYKGNPRDICWVRNPRKPNNLLYGPFQIKENLINKLFCTKVQYRKYKLKKLKEINQILKNG